MSKYRKVHCLIWHDQVFPYLPDDAQLVFFHAFTVPWTTGLGLMTISMEALAASKRWPLERYRKGFGNLSKVGLATYDERFQTVFFPSYLRHNRPDNPNSLKGILCSWSELPDCPHKLELYQTLKKLSTEWGKNYSVVFQTLEKPSGNVPETLREPTRNRERERERERERDKEVSSPELESSTPANGKKPELSLVEPAPPPPTETPCITIPLVDGSTHAVTEADLEQLSTAYPGVDVRQQLRNLRQWNVDSPKQRKTKNGIRRHISSWMAREQNRGGNGSRATTSEQPQVTRPRKNLNDIEL